MQDEAGTYGVEAALELEALGARSPGELEYRGSLALAGYTGPGRPSWVHDVMTSRGKGPSVINIEIPLEFQYNITGKNREYCVM